MVLIFPRKEKEMIQIHLPLELPHRGEFIQVISSTFGIPSNNRVMELKTQ